MNNNQLKLLKIGYIIKPHGIKGELCISLYKYQLEKNQKVFFEHSTNFLGPYTVSSSRKHKNFWIVKTCELNNLNEVKHLSGYSVGIEVKELPKDTFWVEDIIGCEVFTNNGEKLGKVIDVLKTSANDLYVIETKSKKEILIPTIKKLIHEVDIVNKKIYIKKLKGLI